MARIFGIIGDTSSPANFEGLFRLVKSPFDSQKTLHMPGGRFGWSGTGNPNLFSSDGVLVSVDGHFYNTPDLPPSKNLAEIFYELYRKYGFQTALEKINGDFAIACYDEKDQTLWLGRDRFGVRPLYYASKGEFFAFASRPLPLIHHKDIGKEVNQGFVGRFAGAHYRYFDNLPHESPYTKVRQLPAAHALSFKNKKMCVSRYWKLQDLPDLQGSEDLLADQYRSLFLDSVKLRLRAAQKPSFTLSGGMDSSSVLAASRFLSSTKQSAISTVYSDKTYDESDEIQSMLDENVTQWHAINVEPGDIFATVSKMIETHDEPVATATWLSHFILCQKARDLGFQSLFGGLGGDELNAGEYEYFTYFFADLIQSGNENQLNQEIEKWIKYHDHPIFKKNPEVAEENLRKLVDLNSPGRTLVERRRFLRYSQALNPTYFRLEDFQPEMAHPFKSYLKNRTYQDIYFETAPCCLRAEDRQTEAFGLDNFLPFFDHRLVEFMFQIPSHLKIRDGVTKFILRKAMKGILPEETRTRIKKTGWNAPAHKWFSGKGLDRLRDLVGSQKFRERGIYDVKEVQRLIDEHQDVIENDRLKDNHMMFFWQLVNLEMWMQKIELKKY